MEIEDPEVRFKRWGGAFLFAFVWLLAGRLAYHYYLPKYVNIKAPMFSHTGNLVG